MDLDALPDDPLERLEAYRRERRLEEERRRVALVRFKRDLGEPLTEQDLIVEAYSPHGTAGGCPATAFFLGSR